SIVALPQSIELRMALNLFDACGAHFFSQRLSQRNDAPLSLLAHLLDISNRSRSEHHVNATHTPSSGEERATCPIRPSIRPSLSLPLTRILEEPPVPSAHPR